MNQMGIKHLVSVEQPSQPKSGVLAQVTDETTFLSARYRGCQVKGKQFDRISGFSPWLNIKPSLEKLNYYFILTRK